MAESKVFEWAGIGFGEQESYCIQKSLKKLSTDSQAQQVRFWGKIHGTEKDYIIAEGILEGEDEQPEGEEVEKPADFEPRGTGINKFTYWVIDNPITGTWIKLPDILANDVRDSRMIKVSFSGNLEKMIHTNPFFVGQEKHYLRSQIARISHSTTLTAHGVWKLVEDTPREVEENTPEEGDLEWPSTKQMANPAMWVHYQPQILKCCKTIHMEQELPDDAPEELTVEDL